MSATPPAVIALDWGSTHLRAWLMDAEGRVQTHRSSGAGALGLGPIDFDAALAALVGDWVAQHPRAALIACGMVGARGGWCEVPYVDLPAGLETLKQHLRQVPTQLGPTLAIVGGLRSTEPDVLRGEETQALGTGCRDGLLCLPGTHSKWMRLEAGAVTAFRTWFTGELYERLGSEGSLARAFGEPAALDPSAFEEGVALALDAPLGQAWLHTFFGFRARVVGAGEPGTRERARFSGWLIASELCQALHDPLLITDAAAAGPRALWLVAAPTLGVWYQRAWRSVWAALPEPLQAEWPPAFQEADPACSAQGLYRILRAV